MCFKFVVWSISLPPHPPSTPFVSAVLCLPPLPSLHFITHAFPPLPSSSLAHHTMDCVFFFWTVMDLQCSVGLYMHRFFFFVCFSWAGFLLLPPPCRLSIPVTSNSGMATARFVLLTGISVFISCNPSTPHPHPRPLFPPSLPSLPLCSLSPVSPRPLPRPLSVY